MRFDLAIAAGLAVIGADAAAVKGKKTTTSAVAKTAKATKIVPLVIPASATPAAIKKVIDAMKAKKPKAPKGGKVIPVSNDAASSLATKKTTKSKRGATPCSAEVYANQDQSFQGTMADFENNSYFRNVALAASTPTGYNSLWQAYYWAIEDPSYITFTDEPLYDPSTCAAKCDAMSGCNGFDIYFERDPSLNPGDNCMNPAPSTAIKCAYYGSHPQVASATNAGQWRSSFGVVVAGANGYSKRNFQVLSATFAGADVTTGAQSFLSADAASLVIDTTFPTSSISVDPWSDDDYPPKQFAVLYSWNNEIRTFAAYENSGTYPQNNAAFGTGSSDGSTLAAGVNIPSTTGANKYIAIIYGTYQYTSQTLYDAVYSSAASGAEFQVDNGQFGGPSDPNPYVLKTAEFFYQDAHGAYHVVSGREHNAVILP